MRVVRKSVLAVPLLLAMAAGTLTACDAPWSDTDPRSTPPPPAAPPAGQTFRTMPSLPAVTWSHTAAELEPGSQLVPPDGYGWVSNAKAAWSIGDTLFVSRSVGGASPTLTALDPRDGSVRWTAAAGHCRPLPAHGLVACTHDSSPDAELLDPATGERVRSPHYPFPVADIRERGTEAILGISTLGGPGRAFRIAAGTPDEPSAHFVVDDPTPGGSACEETTTRGNNSISVNDSYVAVTVNGRGRLLDARTGKPTLPEAVARPLALPGTGAAAYVPCGAASGSSVVGQAPDRYLGPDRRPLGGVVGAPMRDTLEPVPGPGRRAVVHTRAGAFTEDGHTLWSDPGTMVTNGLFGTQIGDVLLRGNSQSFEAVDATDGTRLGKTTETPETIKSGHGSIVGTDGQHVIDSNGQAYTLPSLEPAWRIPGLENAESISSPLVVVPGGIVEIDEDAVRFRAATGDVVPGLEDFAGWYDGGGARSGASGGAGSTGGSPTGGAAGGAGFSGTGGGPVTACGRRPTVEPVSAVDDDGHQAIVFRMKATCPGGDVITGDAWFSLRRARSSSSGGSGHAGLTGLAGLSSLGGATVDFSGDPLRIPAGDEGTEVSVTFPDLPAGTLPPGPLATGDWLVDCDTPGREDSTGAASGTSSGAASGATTAPRGAGSGAGSGSAASCSGSVPYTIPRFGFSTRLPCWTRRVDDLDGGGATFSGEGGTIRVVGTNSPSKDTDLHAELVRRRAQITYENFGTRAYTVTGYDGAEVFYFLQYSGPGSGNILEWRFPREKLGVIRPFIDLSADSSVPGDLSAPH